MSHIKDHYSRLKKLAAEYGATTVLDKSRKHPAALVTTADGKQFRLVFAGTPSCPNASINNLQDLRRQLRLHGAKRK